jgi:hypothetical protein
MAHTVATIVRSTARRRRLGAASPDLRLLDMTAVPMITASQIARRGRLTSRPCSSSQTARSSDGVTTDGSPINCALPNRRG